MVLTRGLYCQPALRSGTHRAAEASGEAFFSQPYRWPTTVPTNQAREAALGKVDIVPMAFFLRYRSMYPVQAPVIDVILAPVLFVDGSVVEAVNHAVNSQHVRLVGRHCPLRLYDHRRAPWHKSQSISMLDELRQKCGNEQNGKRRMWLLQVVWWGGLLTDSGEKLVEPSPETRLVRAYLNS